jgi:hypothetical protein
MLLEVWERGPLSKLACNTGPKPVEQSCTGNWEAKPL